MAKTKPLMGGESFIAEADWANDGIELKQSFSAMKLGNHGLIVSALSAVFFFTYAYLFWGSVGAFWFDPNWTTDDGLQQLYPFHSVNNPHIFDGDLITEVMAGYLPPIHYWISYVITWLTGDPIVMGHWVMFLQLTLTLFFMFGAVRYVAGTPAAFFSMAWILHSRDVVQRMTAGLPRGWAAVVITAYFFFTVRRSQRGVLAVILVGCLLHPPSTFIVALSYGMYLSYGFLRQKSRSEFSRPLLWLILCAPIFGILAYFVVQRPEYIGQMVTLSVAQTMPEFQSPNGRFPYLPFRPAWAEIKWFGFQAFLSRFHYLTPEVRGVLPTVIIGLFISLFIIGALRKRSIVPREIFWFPLAALITYAAAREFAFKLYVPDRHLQFPLCFFMILAASAGVWRALHSGAPAANSEAEQSSFRQASWGGLIGLVALASLIYFCSGMGLRGAANFNYSLDKKGKVFTWLKKNTPTDALIAGYPTFIDGTQLFAMRRAYVTTETAHPFYYDYAMEMRKRLELSLRAHYARDFKELADLLEPAGVNYFVFERKRFYPDELAQATYHSPHDQLVRELASRHYLEYAYRKLPQEMDPEKYPFMTFKDAYSVVVDVAKLRSYLKGQNG